MWISSYSFSDRMTKLSECTHLTMSKKMLPAEFWFFAPFGVRGPKMGQNYKNHKIASPEYSLNVTVLHIQLDIVTRILKLQTESKNIENWQNGGQKSVDFRRFFGFFEQNGQNASSIHQPNITALHIQLDLVIRISNLHISSIFPQNRFFYRNHPVG